MSKRKLIGAALVLMLAVTGLTFAKGGQDAKAASGAKVYRVAYIARTQGDSFASWLLDSAKEVAAKNPEIKMDFFDGQNNNDLIRTHMENAIVNKYDAILLHPNDPEAQVAPAHEALDAGLVVVAVNTIVNSKRVPMVDANPYEQGAVNARYALKTVPQGIKAVVLLGSAGNRHSIERHEAWQKEFFAKRPDIKILDTQIANWNKEEGMVKMEDWIQAYGKDIGMIVSMNDNMVLGALEAYKGVAGPLPLAYGVDGTAEAALAISEGRLVTTSLQSAYDLGELSVQMVYDYLTKKKVTPELVIVPNPVYTKENVEELLNIHRARGIIK